MNPLALLLVFNLLSVCVFAQSREEKAAKNFETFFTSFKNAYPADRNKDVFKNYSDLWVRKAMPEEIKMMIEYNSQNFYSTYLYHIKNSHDTLIKISTLEYSPSIKQLYLKFKKSIIAGERSGKFNYKQDKDFAEQLKYAIDQVNLPIIGYYQSAIIVVQSLDGTLEENKIIITYTNELETMEFNVVE